MEWTAEVFRRAVAVPATHQLRCTLGRLSRTGWSEAVFDALALERWDQSRWSHPALALTLSETSRPALHLALELGRRP